MSKAKTPSIILELTGREAELLATILFKGVRFGTDEDISRAAWAIYEALSDVDVYEDDSYPYRKYADLRRDTESNG